MTSAPPAADPTPDSILYEHHRRTMAAVLGLEHLPDEWNASVTGFLMMAADAARLYVEFPLDDIYDEPAPVFVPARAGEPA